MRIILPPSLTFLMDDQGSLSGFFRSKSQETGHTQAGQGISLGSCFDRPGLSVSTTLSSALERERERFCSRDGEEASLILSAFPVRVPLSYYHHGQILWCMQYVHTLQLACFARTSHPLCLLDADAKWSYCRYLRYRLPSHVDLRCDPTSRVNCWYVVSLSLSLNLFLSPPRVSRFFL